MAWIYLVISGIFEVAWAIGLKYSENFTKLWPSLGTIAVMGVGFLLLSKALNEIPIDTAYAVWTGIGTVGTAILGIVIFGESSELLRIACIGLIVIGIIGLKVSFSIK